MHTQAYLMLVIDCDPNSLPFFFPPTCVIKYMYTLDYFVQRKAGGHDDKAQ